MQQPRLTRMQCLYLIFVIVIRLEEALFEEENAKSESESDDDSSDEKDVVLLVEGGADHLHCHSLSDRTAAWLCESVYDIQLSSSMRGF